MDFEVQSVTRISGDNQLEKSVVMQQIHGSSFSGDFCAASKSSLPFPGIIIRPFGIVPLPLIPVVLSALKQAVDSKTHKVRDYAFEFDPATISFTNPTWDDELDIHLDRMLDALGLKRSDVERRLDRVILDEKGFRRRKQATDSIQVASFEVQFPSNFKGGSHRVCHQGLDSVFRLGADDSSCANNCWLLARYADCEHEIQDITEGSRLVASYSLLWKGNSQPPRAPPMDSVLALERSLRDLNGYAGLYLMGAAPETLGRRGFDGLHEDCDRVKLGLLRAASARLAQGDPADELVLHVCTAAMLEDWDELSAAELKLERRIYCPDGAEPGPAARAVLSGFRFPEDMVPLPEPDGECEYETRLNHQGVDIAYDWWQNQDPAWEHDRGEQVVPSTFGATHTTLAAVSRCALNAFQDLLASGRLALRSALSDLTAARRQVREYAAHVLTIWRKSLEAPLRLLVDPEARKPPLPPPPHLVGRWSSILPSHTLAPGAGPGLQAGCSSSDDCV